MVKERAVTAFENIKGADAKTENQEQVVIRAVQLGVFSDIMIQSFDGKTIVSMGKESCEWENHRQDGKKIVPFLHLDRAKKKTIGELIELPVPGFVHNGWSFSDCLLLHRLLVIGGQWEEVLLRTKLSSIPSHTVRLLTAALTGSCERLVEVSIPLRKDLSQFSSLLHCFLSGDSLASGSRVQLCLDSQSDP